MNKPATYNSQRFDLEALRRENLQFADTTGVSANNRGLGFVPAFMDTETGNVYLSRFANGTPAPIHVLAGLPDNLTEAHGESAAALSIKSSVISGFVREDTFYSREQAAQATALGRMH
ncbi:MAG: hypothetical protein ABF290_11805 [Thiogranum sp.]